MNKLNRTICNNVSTNNAPFDQREMERERERESERDGHAREVI